MGDALPVVDLGAWGNDPLVITALKEKIDAVMQPSAVAAEVDGDTPVLSGP